MTPTESPRPTPDEYAVFVEANRATWIKRASMSMPRQDAEDTVSVATLNGLIALQTFKGAGPFENFMRTIVRNAFYDYWRRPEQRFKHVPMWGDDDIAPAFLKETVTRTVLHLEITERVAANAGLSPLQRACALSDDGHMSTALRNARYQGIAKVRAAIGGIR